MNFLGAAEPIQDGHFARAAASLKVEEAALRAIVEVECRHSGFDKLGRPTMLFEPHKFWAHLPSNLRGLAQSNDFAYPRWGEQPYPSDSYPRLKEILLSMPTQTDAALMSCSWGMGQIMGEHFHLLGYATVSAMVEDACASEGKQLDQMIGFLRSTGIVVALRGHDWKEVARRYNGTGYAKNKYDTLLAKAYTKWASKTPPLPRRKTNTGLSDHAIRRVQTQLSELGYKEVGKADAIWGSRTTAAVAAFQHEADLPITGELDDKTEEALADASPRIIAPERAEAITIPGSRTLALSNSLSVGGVATALAGASTALDKGEEIKSFFVRASDLFSPLVDHPALGIVLIGAAILAIGLSFRHFRLSDHRVGKLA